MEKVTPERSLADFRGGDRGAFTKIVAKYNRSLRYFAYSMLKNSEVAEEIVNDGFFKLWLRRGNFESYESIQSFLYIATRNACLNYIQSPTHRLQPGDIEAEQLLSSDPDIETQLIETELLEIIYREIERLPDKQQHVFRLFFLEGLTAEEIADTLGISINAVYLNKSLAIKSLRLLLKGREFLFYFFLLKNFWGN